jgi:hypothetical protein
MLLRNWRDLDSLHKQNAPGMQRLNDEASKLIMHLPIPIPRRDPYSQGRLQRVQCQLKTTGGDCPHLVQQSLGQLLQRLGLPPHFYFDGDQFQLKAPPPRPRAPPRPRISSPGWLGAVLRCAVLCLVTACCTAHALHVLVPAKQAWRHDTSCSHSLAPALLRSQGVGLKL